MKTRASGQSFLLLGDIIPVLDGLLIPYIIIGALAVSFYGLPRASMGADALIGPARAVDLEALCGKLRQAGLDVSYRRGDRDDPVLGVAQVRDAAFNQVDLLTGIKGISPEVFSRARKQPLGRRKVSVAAPEDLVAMKILAGSRKDIEDVSGILDVSRQEGDGDILERVSSLYGKAYISRLTSLSKNVTCPSLFREP